MSNELANGSWERVAKELRACKETQQKSWGTIDNTTLGRYLAGEVSDHELAEVENALEELPELRKLTDLVRDVLADLEPVELDAPVQPTPEPIVLAFSPPVPSRRKRFASFLRQRSSLAAAACLLLTFALAMPRPGFLSAPRLSEMPAVSNGFASTRALPPAAAPVLIGSDREFALLGAPKELGSADNGEEASLALFKAESAGTSRSEARDPRKAGELNRQASQYRLRGDLVRAVPLQQQTHLMCQEKLGPNHPTTQKTVRYLAFAYQTALNSPELAPAAPGGGAKSPEPAPPLPRSGTTMLVGSPAATATYQNALVLREQIVDRTTQDVQTSVVPVLTQALRTEPNLQKRLNLVRAIASLGPAGGNAVPALTERLENTSDPSEVRVVIEALDEIGPAARGAVPTLVALSDECCEGAVKHKRTSRPDQRGGHGGKKSDSPRRFSPSEEKSVRKVLARFNSPQGRAGVDDRAGCFSVRAVCLANRTIRALAKKSKVEILVETVCPACASPRGCMKETAKDGKSESQFRKMGKRAIHVTFSRDGTSVEVQVSDSLRRAGVTPEKVRKCLQERLRLRQYDKALDDSIQFVKDVALAK